MMGFDPACEKCGSDMEQDLILKTNYYSYGKLPIGSYDMNS